MISFCNLFLKRMFDLVAEDAAIEDTLYFLNRALEGDAIDVENFLKVLV